MATVSEKLARTIITNNGHYEDDPQAFAVVSYQNLYTPALRCWAICYSASDYLWYASLPGFKHEWGEL